MSEHTVTALVRAADHAELRAATGSGARIDDRDGDGWSGLDWAAGLGDTVAIRILLDHGADPTATGREQRTPYQIALAAGHRDAARMLRQAVETADPAAADGHFWKPYCKAYQICDLRRFADWSEAGEQLPDDGVVFVHDDLSVTRSMWHGEDVVFAGTTEDWARFCRDDLAFGVPDDFDLVPDRPANS